MMRPRTLTIPLAALVLALGAAACTDNTSGSSEEGESAGSGTGDTPSVQVTSTDDECTLSATELPSGNVVFEVTNEGSQVTEFYLLESDATSIVGEVENIGPGLSRNLVVRAEPGDYVTSCRPGMTGDGIQADFTITDSGDTGEAEDAELVQLEEAAVAQYEAYVDQQVELLVTGTAAFAEAYKSGDDELARSLYAPTRFYWESIEPVAESFGDLDPRLDLREVDLEEGQVWTGWHRAEKDLWPPDGFTGSTPEERAEIADQLVADTDELAGRIAELELRTDQLGNGAKELMDEVATGKVTGEEEAWSHTDLWDFQANVDGSRVAYQALRPIVMVKQPELAEELDGRFEDVQAALDVHKVGDGWVYYDQLTPDQVRELSDQVNALGEPLSTLTSVVVL